MRETKSLHTPGPWGIRASLDGSCDVGITAPNVPNVIAECFSAMRHADERASGEAAANAFLIASAPDLYAALRSLANTADGFRFIEEEIRTAAGNTNWEVLRKHIDDARAALAKAEGGQS